MKGNPYKMGKIATKSTIAKMKTSYKMKEAMAKMKSPMELKKDSPMDKYKSDAQRKAVHASKAERGMTMKSPMEAAKPDYIDLDGDGNKTESMKKAAADKKSSPAKLAKGRDVMATEGKYKGQMVDPRTGMPKGVSGQKTASEIANADQIAMLRKKMKTVEPFSAEEEAIQQQIIRLRKGTSPSQMKSPLEKGKTRFLDKVKSAAGAVKDTIKQEIKSPAGHGTSDSMTNRLSRNYKSRKKQARSAAPMKKEAMRDAAADKKKASGKVSKKASGKVSSIPGIKVNKKASGKASDKKGAMTMKKSALEQDKKKKRKLSVMDKIKAASAAASTSKGPFGDTNFLDRYKQEKKKIRKGTFTGDSFKTG